MSKLEIITLVLGVSIVVILTYLYLRFRIGKAVLRQYIIQSDKTVRRTYYILKKAHYTVERFKGTFYFDILFDNKIIKNKFSVVAVARKENRKYLCFTDAFLVSDFSINYEILFKTAVSGFHRCLLVNTSDFTLQEVKIL